MNNKRRAHLNKVMQTLHQVRSEVEDLYLQEFEAYEGIPPNLQAEDLDIPCWNLEQALELVEKTVTHIEDAIKP
jgi:hypothetical protein